EGRITGENNDYLFSCGGGNGGGGGVVLPAECTQWCCPGDRKSNLFQNGDFEDGNSGFTSSYAYNASIGQDAVKPGQYNVVIAPAAPPAICRNWVANDHYSCKCPGAKPSKSHIMVVNGLTCQPAAGQPKIIWEQTIPNIGVPVTRTYRFCANFKSFAACC